MGAPEPHDFAVRVPAARQSAQPASAAFHSTFVTIAIRPLCRRGMGAVNHDFGKNESRIFLREGLDNPNQIDATCEIGFCAQAVGGTGTRCLGGKWTSLQGKGSRCIEERPYGDIRAKLTRVSGSCYVRQPLTPHEEPSTLLFSSSYARRTVRGNGLRQTSCNLSSYVGCSG